MTKEEQIDWLCRLRADLNNGVIFTPWKKEFTEALNGVLEQEPFDDAKSETPSEDAISRKSVLAFIKAWSLGGWVEVPESEWNEFVLGLPSVKQEPKIGHWIPLGNYDEWGNENSYKCSECGDIDTYPDNYCPNCGAKMVQESETWNGIHAQIIAPKGTFERIFNEADDDNDI